MRPTAILAQVHCRCSDVVHLVGLRGGGANTPDHLDQCGWQQQPHLGPEITYPRVRQYASRVGASFRVIAHEDEVSTPTTLSANAWQNHTAYVLKILAVYDALESHDEVLLIDDTVFIVSTANDVFAACPPEVSGGTRAAPLTVISHS